MIYQRKTADIYISDSLKVVLNEIKNSSIVAELLLRQRHKIEDLVDNFINYISISNSDGSKLSYLTQDRIKNLSESEYWSTSRRFQVKPGSFVNKLFKNINAKDIECFSTLYRNATNKQKLNFKIVNGEDIRHYYLADNYVNNNGSLGNSCMKHDCCQNFLDIYVYNNTISMLVLLDNNDMLIGRALLWDFHDTKGEDIQFKIMDRIYTINDEEYLYHFKSWANKNNYIYKSEQRWNNTLFFEKDGVKLFDKLEIKLENWKYNRYPYMDTFKFLNTKTGSIFNYIPHDQIDYIRTICTPDGSTFSYDHFKFCDIDNILYNRGEIVRLDYLNKNVYSEKVCWSETNNTYIMREHSTYDNDCEDHIFIGEYSNLNNMESINEKRNIIRKIRERRNEGIMSRSWLSDWRSITSDSDEDIAINAINNLINDHITNRYA